MDDKIAVASAGGRAWTLSIGQVMLIFQSDAGHFIHTVGHFRCISYLTPSLGPLTHLSAILFTFSDVQLQSLVIDLDLCFHVMPKSSLASETLAVAAMESACTYGRPEPSDLSTSLQVSSFHWPLCGL